MYKSFKEMPAWQEVMEVSDINKKLEVLNNNLNKIIKSLRNSTRSNEK